MNRNTSDTIYLKPYVDYRGQPPVGWSSWAAYWRAQWKMARKVMQGRPWWQS